MRKNIIVSVILTLCVVVLSFACIKSDGVNTTTVKKSQNEVLTISQNSGVEDKALETRFLNMLNHNFVYDDAFYDDAALVNDSMIALLDVAEDSYISQEHLGDYLFNMYGKIYSDYSFLGEESLDKAGYVYLLPRGYSEYSHTIVSVNANEDGSYTVLTDVAVSSESGTQTLKCETLFLVAEDSAFGYNMLYSDIIELNTSEADC